MFCDWTFVVALSNFDEQAMVKVCTCALDLDQSSERIRIQDIEKINIFCRQTTIEVIIHGFVQSCIIDAGDGVSVVTGSPKGDVLIGESGRRTLVRRA